MCSVNVLMNILMMWLMLVWDCLVIGELMMILFCLFSFDKNVLYEVRSIMYSVEFVFFVSLCRVLVLFVFNENVIWFFLNV